MVEEVLAGWTVVVKIDYMHGLKCAGRCLFSCQHFENISDFLFSWVFCDR